MQIALEFRCSTCDHLCISSVHYGMCCIDRGEKNPCKMCHAYKTNIAMYFAKEYPTGDKEIDFILKHKLNIIYNYEYLQRIKTVNMELSPESAFEIIKSIDKVEDYTKEDDPIMQLRGNLCFVLQVDEDDINGLTFNDYINLKMEEMQ